MFVKHVCPPNDSLFDIQHWTENMYIKWYKPQNQNVLVVTNLHTKFEDPRSIFSKQGLELHRHFDLDL